ncbi:MAG: aldo/keto reductase [Clostridia bacterium]|nr:aldo/keto reductase [Clostridia bacterium]
MILPKIGMGTWQITDREIMKQVILNGYETGYRLIDTAAAYSNEIAIAKAIEAIGLSRSEFILSDKVWNTSRGYEQVQEACKRSLKKLKTDYLDLYLIHWPASMKLYPDWAQINADTWSGMEKLYNDGLVRAIGVCNFKPHHLKKLKETAEIIPMVDQLECHPGLNQKEIRDCCALEHMIVEASSPLGNGQILENEKLREIAWKYGRTAAQLCIRWTVQSGMIAIPKTVSPEKMRQNANLFDFELSEEEMKQIDDLPYCGGIGIDPDEVTEFG